MERDGVYLFGVSIVVLQQMLRSRVEDLDLLVSSTRGKASAIRVEADVLNHACMVSERVHRIALLNVPKHEGPVI